MSAHLCGYAETGTYTGQVVLVAPDWLKHKHPNGIGVDVCLALEISNLWKHGIQTSGHCCGHGRLPAYISVWPEFVEQMRTLGYETLSHPDGRPDHFRPKTPGLSPCELDRETLERAAEVVSASNFFVGCARYLWRRNSSPLASLEGWGRNSLRHPSPCRKGR